jgi:hypothetical protein
MTKLRDGSPLDVRAAIKVGDLIVTTIRRVAILALGLITIASAAPAFAQTNGDRMSAARVAALRECNRQAGKYIEHTWGDNEIYIYPACMTEHGQQE